MTPLQQADAELIALMVNGDERAFETIYRRYAGELFRYIRKNIYRKEECEEIIQEIFEALWSRRESLEIMSSLPGYLMGMARHKIIRYFQKGTLIKKYQDHFLFFEAVYDQAAEQEVDHSAIQATLDRIMRELPERCQQALRLRLSENLSNGDIARRMNISIRTVEVYMFRSFNHIRDSYRKYADQALLISLLISAIFAQR